MHIQDTMKIKIKNNDDKCVYSSEGIKENSNNTNIKEVSKKISGGYSVHYIDTTSVQNLNNRLKETTEIIEARNGNFRSFIYNQSNV